MKGLKPQFSAIFAEFEHIFFQKVADRVPFGWIRHNPCTEMTTDKTFLRAKSVARRLWETD